MEIGVVGFDRIPSSGDGLGSVCVDSARFECLKQERSGFYDESWRASKMAKNVGDDFSLGVGTFPFKSTSSTIDATLPYFQHMEATQCRNSGYYSSGGLDGSSGVYLVSGVRGPFTPSQWLELEQQALIYKYIISNEPIPVHLLIPIRRTFESAGFYGLNGATLKSNSWGWGPFHLGYSNSNDPEPGRCRRTDGKKWRCARDAVANQKYCEKHMNRGRHRSRKHVEGQGNGHSVSGGATNKSSTTKPIPPTAAASSAAPSVLPGGGSSYNFDIDKHQHFQGKSLYAAASNLNVNASLNRMIVNSENSGQALQDATQLSYLSQGMNLNCSGSSFSNSKHQICNQEPTLIDFGTPSTDPLLDVASHKHFGSYDNNGGADRLSTQYSRLQSQSGSTQLSMSFPMGPADFMSSTSSPINEKSAVSPLRLSQEHQMGLGFGFQIQSPGQANWKPVSWEASMGGPLAEALQSSSTSNNTDESAKSPALSLLPGSCQLSSSSPTGVLQKSELVSLSNSAGSSPRADNSKAIEGGGSLCTDLLGSATLAIASSLPDLS